MTKAAKPSNLEYLNGLLMQISAIDQKLAKLDAARKAALEKIETAHAKKATPLADQRTKIETAMMKFCQDRRDQLFTNGSKYIDLPSGRIGFRASTAIVIKDVANIISRLRNIFSDRPSAIIVKESVNKLELKNWSDEDLSIIGAERVSEDRFYYEPKN